MAQAKKTWQDWWAAISPAQKRILTIAGIAAAVLSVMWIGDLLMAKDNTKHAQKNDVVRNVLTDTDTRKLGIDGLAASLQRLRREMSTLSEQMTKYTETQERLTQQRNTTVDKELADLKKAMRALKTEKEQAVSRREPSDDSAKSRIKNGMEAIIPPDRHTSSVTSQSLFADMNETSSSDFLPAPSVVKDKKPIKINTINTVKASRNKASAKSTATEAGTHADFYLPAGTILSAVMLNGLDASTSSGAKSEPAPALLRVEKEAILPNRFSSDIRDCFILASGHGDLSSERAYLRGEYLSCIRNDGGVLETKFPSYVVGEDGKTGMRGRLVSKQGQVIARSLVAGFASGVSKAFDVTPVSVLDTTNVSGKVQYQSNYDTGMLQGAAAQGASRSLEKVADFYLKMAEQIFPVVEITAGRHINVIVSAGTLLSLESINTVDADRRSSSPTTK